MYRQSFLSVFICALIGISIADKWNTQNNPNQFSSKLIFQQSQLPLSGEVSQQPWSDTYWPSFQSGIAHRWNSPNPIDFDYTLNSKDALKKMSSNQLALLSPAEKYDIFAGRYDYPTVKAEWSRTSPGDQKWEGLCHGWAPAALHYQQPQPVTLKNKDGIPVPFGSSDIKALLTYWVAMYDESEAETAFVGQRCQYDIENQPEYENTTNCIDLNAGSFHVLLTNMVAKRNQGFVIDRDRSIQVWNQPLFSYSSKIAQQSGSQILINTQISYAKETYPQWQAHDTYVVSEEYSYWIELDSTKKIQGGSHQTWARPDFMWNVAINDFSGYFSLMDTIYNSSVGAEPMESPSSAESFVPKPMTPAQVLTGETGTFGTPKGLYPLNYRTRWSIAPSKAASSITIHFDYFHTERYRDLVKIYEGANGEGPIVAVFHGDQIPEDFVVNAPGALVTFKTDHVGSEKGFSATYTCM